MNKQEKVNYIKYWLQRHGKRNNEGFFEEVELEDKTWDLSLQYHFSDDGEELLPSNYCCKSFKHLFENKIKDRTEQELDEIIEKLNNKI